jgi:DNA-binding response OmpR family regulator
MNSAGGDPQTVLVVDDEPDLCEIIRRMLDGRGYAVLTAGGVVDAVTRCDTHKGALDLLMTDLRMPDGNGRDLARTIRMRRPETAVLYMSGLPPHADQVIELVGTESAVLAKPFTPTELIAAVTAALAAK